VRILHVNKFLYRRGGAEAYMDDLASLQRAAGHEVEFFGMQHPENPPARFSHRFPTLVDLEPPPPSLVGKLRGAARVLWSTSAQRGMADVLREFAPDVVHLHNVYHQLSPSILQPVAEMGVPAVMTLHDYKLACPTYQMLDHGSPCEACLGGRLREAVRHRCKGGSLTASALCATELWLHRATGAYDPVQRFVAPSRFLLNKMIQAGVFPARLRWIPHFVDCARILPRTETGTGIVYAGRLAPEKGVDTLIEAVARLGPGVVLNIAGDGPESPRLAALAERLAPGRIVFHGRLPKAELHALVRSAAVAAVPSRWYENQPMAVLEAQACGVPVVASDIGGLSELIEPGVSGALVPPGEPEALAEAAWPLLAQPSRGQAMGRAGRARVEAENSPAVHRRHIEAVYAEAALGGGLAA
jgi:glycosyltransferase involved in cell wall biosynthesis